MSIEAAAGQVADRLSESDFIRVFGHNDADGIASATIMCHALYRLGKKFHLTIRDRITLNDIKKGENTLLCDFGSSMTDLYEDVIVIDHHMTGFNGEYHVNPRLCGIDGDTELSASGTAYITANRLGDNRDLCGLALLGIIGDRQKIAGKNQEIISEGIGNHYLLPRRRMALCGRNPKEQLYTAINPYLSGVSGNKEVVDRIVDSSTKKQDIERSLDIELDYQSLLSQVIFETAEDTNEVTMQSIWKDTYELERGVIHDAQSMSDVVEACGLSGRGDLGVMLCLRNGDVLDEAWEITNGYRLNVISAIKNAKKTDDTINLFEVEDMKTASPAADAIANDGLFESPVFVISKNESICRVSARCPNAKCDGYNLGELMKELALKTGGTGGGHATRAGAVFDVSELKTFKEGIKEAMS